MFGLRFPLCVALAIAGCGGDLDVGVTASALNSCNLDGDCPLPMQHGTCVKAACNNHACEYVMDTTACPAGCTLATQATDCNLGGTNCFIVKCINTVCAFNDYSASSGCQCTSSPPGAGECTAPNGCQNAATCNSATCTYTAKQPLLGSACCNVTADCGGTATCGNNTCGCGGDKFCPGVTVGAGRCVPTSGCCVPADCPAGNACQARTCSAAGVCGLASNGNAGCCDPANGTSDCAARGNATVACTANTCVYTCDAGFHDCSGVCKDDASPASCGTMCSACPTGNSCQTATCSAGACGLVGAGASPCCNTVADCTPANACQTASACSNNMCSFASTGAAGCCNSAADCAAPADPCLQATCVANQCATTPVAGCTDDLGTPLAPDDLANPIAPPSDLATAGSLAGGGGCALGGDASSTSLFALLLVAFALRRRRA